MNPPIPADHLAMVEISANTNDMTHRERRIDLINARMPTILEQTGQIVSNRTVLYCITNFFNKQDCMFGALFDREQVKERNKILGQDDRSLIADSAVDTLKMAINAKVGMGSGTIWTRKIRDIIFWLYFQEAQKNAPAQGNYNRILDTVEWSNFISNYLDAVSYFEGLTKSPTDKVSHIQNEVLVDQSKEPRLSNLNKNGPLAATENENPNRLLRLNSATAQGIAVGYVGGGKFILEEKSQRVGFNDLPVDLNLSLQTRYPVESAEFDIICNTFLIVFYHQEGPVLQIRDLRQLRDENNDFVIHPDGEDHEHPWWRIELRNDDRQMRIADEALLEFIDQNDSEPASVYCAEVYLDTDHHIRVDPKWGSNDVQDNGNKNATRARLIELLIQQSTAQVDNNSFRDSNYPIVAQRILNISRL